MRSPPRGSGTRTGGASGAGLPAGWVRRAISEIALVSLFNEVEKYY